MHGVKKQGKNFFILSLSEFEPFILSSSFEKDSFIQVLGVKFHTDMELVESQGYGVPERVLKSLRKKGGVLVRWWCPYGVFRKAKIYCYSENQLYSACMDDRSVQTVVNRLLRDFEPV